MTGVLPFSIGFILGIWAGLVIAAGVIVWYHDKDNYWRENDVRDRYEAR